MKNRRSEIQFWRNMRKKDIHITPVQGELILLLVTLQELTLLASVACMMSAVHIVAIAVPKHPSLLIMPLLQHNGRHKIV